MHDVVDQAGAADCERSNDERDAGSRLFSGSVLHQAGVSNIRVFDVTGKQVDKKDTHSDRANRSVLCVSLIPALTAGSYKVVWRVTSADTHVTNGDFHFEIVP